MSNKKVKIRIESDGAVIEKEIKCMIGALLDYEEEDDNLKVQALLIGHDISPTNIGQVLADMPDGFFEDLPESAEAAYRKRMLENTKKRLAELVVGDITEKAEKEAQGMENIVSDFTAWLKDNAEGGAR